MICISIYIYKPFGGCVYPRRLTIVSTFNVTPLGGQPQSGNRTRDPRIPMRGWNLVLVYSGFICSISFHAYDSTVPFTVTHRFPFWEEESSSLSHPFLVRVCVLGDGSLNGGITPMCSRSAFLPFPPGSGDVYLAPSRSAPPAPLTVALVIKGYRVKRWSGGFLSVEPR